MTYRTMEQFRERYFPRGCKGEKCSITLCRSCRMKAGAMRWIERTPAELDVEKRGGELLRRQGRREVPG